VLAPGALRPFFVSADLLVGDSAGERRLKADLTADTDLLGGGAWTHIDVIGRVDYGAERARGALRLRREARRYAGSGSCEIIPSEGPLRALRLTSCEGTAPLSVAAAQPSAAELSCRYELVLSTPAARRAGLKKAATGKVQLNAGLAGSEYRAVLKADIDPIKAWYELAGDFVVRASGRLDRALKTASLSHELRVSAKVRRFEDLVAFLHGTDYAVPAPIHILKGPLSLALESRGDPHSDAQAVHYAFTSDLASPPQRLDLRASGDLRVSSAWTPQRSYEHAGELVLKEVALELPRLEIGGGPNVFIDKRIKTAGAMPSPPAAGKAPAARLGGRSLPLRSRLVLKTEKPLILLSNLIKGPVPAALDMSTTYPPVEAAGRISIGRFDVELFRRSATIDHLNLTRASGGKDVALEGLIRYKAPAAEISILILGTAAKPRIEFSSVPPMKREDIIALLIFGKSPDELDSGQTASVSNTGAALQNRAFDLASLYLFGTTPIERVGYDPATKTASVKLRLPGGARLEIGSDFEKSRELRLRKQLGAHWAIQSEVSDQGQQSMSAATFLEWFIRY